MTTGVGFNGSCYVDSAAVLVAHKLLYPMMDGSHVVEFGSASISGATMSYTVGARSLDSDTVSSRSGSVLLESCELGGGFIAEQGLLFIGLFLIVWALGFNGGLKR